MFFTDNSKHLYSADFITDLGKRRVLIEAASKAEVQTRAREIERQTQSRFLIASVTEVFPFEEAFDTMRQR